MDEDEDLDCPCWKCRQGRFWERFKRFINIRAHIRRYNCSRNKHTWEKGRTFWNVCKKCWHIEHSGIEPVTAEDYIQSAAERLAFQERHYIMQPLYGAVANNDW